MRNSSSAAVSCCCAEGIPSRPTFTGESIPPTTGPCDPKPLQLPCPAARPREPFCLPARMSGSNSWPLRTQKLSNSNLIRVTHLRRTAAWFFQSLASSKPRHSVPMMLRTIARMRTARSVPVPQVGRSLPGFPGYSETPLAPPPSSSALSTSPPPSGLPLTPNEPNRAMSTGTDAAHSICAAQSCRPRRTYFSAVRSCSFIFCTVIARTSRSLSVSTSRAILACAEGSEPRRRSYSLMTTAVERSIASGLEGRNEVGSCADPNL
mmetsp:Transcript_4426/g.11608  ORF Transcript_4426/g.11608 Transcript_4426/m.11608 type:complete len:264 (-) Transcript_4426:81-872(-)